MTDALFELNGEGGLDTNPITQSQKVVYNGFRNDSLIRANQERMKKHKTKYPGPMNDEHVSILPKELVFVKKGFSGKRTSAEHAMQVLSTVAGIGDKNDPLWKIIEEHDIVGVSATRSLKDSRGNSPEVDVVIQVGGLTSIINTGHKRIENGDAVYGEWPDPSHPYDSHVRKNSERQPLLTMPYDPTLDAITANSLVDILTKPMTAGQYEEVKKQPIVESAMVLQDSILQFVLEAWHIGLATGILSMNDNALEKTKSGFDERKKAGRKYLATDMSGKPQRAELLKKLARFLDLAEEKYEPLDVPVPTKEGQKETTKELKDFVIQTILAKDERFLLLPLKAGTNNVPTGPEGDIIRDQKSLISDLFFAVEKGTAFRKRRVIGKALSPADPGKPFDIILGRYCT